MINLDSIFKSRDITLPTKVRLVKAMVFPVIMYGCESWTVKKAEHRRIDAFELWCCRSEERRVGKEWKQCQTLFLGALKSLQMVTVAMKLKDACSLEEKL